MAPVTAVPPAKEGERSRGAVPEFPSGRSRKSLAGETRSLSNSSPIGGGGVKRICAPHLLEHAPPLGREAVLVHLAPVAPEVAHVLADARLLEPQRRPSLEHAPRPGQMPRKHNR